MNLIFGHP
jgi:succinyl-CoA synthetase beta subunit